MTASVSSAISCSGLHIFVCENIFFSCRRNTFALRKGSKLIRRLEHSITHNIVTKFDDTTTDGTADKELLRRNAGLSNASRASQPFRLCRPLRATGPGTTPRGR